MFEVANIMFEVANIIFEVANIILNNQCFSSHNVRESHNVTVQVNQSVFGII